MIATSELNVEDNIPIPSWKDKYRFSAGAYLLILFQLISGMGAYCYIQTMPIYMASILGFTDSQSTIIYHAKSSLTYLCNIFGAVLADSLLGRIKTYFVFTPWDIMLMGGIVIMSIFSLTPGILTCYFLIAVIGGCVGPALRTFIADQIPSNNPIMLSTYLHIIYFVNNFGVIIIAFVMPIMHKDIYCFAMECYPLVFATSFFLILASFSLFLSGFCFNKFVINQPTNDLFINIIKCTYLAIKRRIQLGPAVNGKSFLDYAEDKYDASFIKDLKIAKGLCVFLLAHPLFWTVFEQLSSVWTLQAQYMDGMVTKNYIVKADQMQTLNPLLVVLLIPIYEILIYPMLNKLNFKVPYRIVAGQIFTALACVSMIFIQMQIDRSIKPAIGLGEMKINLVNLGGTDMSVSSGIETIQVMKSQMVPVTFTKQGYLTFQWGTIQLNKTLFNQDNIVTAIITKSNDTSYRVITSGVKVQENGGYAFVRVVNIVEGITQTEIKLRGRVGINKVCTLTSKNQEFGDFVKCGVGVFDVILDKKIIGSVTLYPAESKVIILAGEPGSLIVIPFSEFRLKLPSIFWQIVPYIFVTLGEVLFNVNTGIFLYGEAPMSMKSILLAAQYICISIGNILILLLRQILKNVGNIYLFPICAILVLCSGLLTAILGYYYLRDKAIIESDKLHSLNTTDF